MKVLVTGGAGYVGSHVLLDMQKADMKVVIVDDLCTGHRELVHTDAFFEVSTGNLSQLKSIFKAERFDAVVHMAAHVSVEESVNDPLKYFQNNVANTINVLMCCREFSVKHFIFSSTAVVYNTLNDDGLVETDTPDPQNPYGLSKLQAEKIIQHFARSYGMSFVILRYFNVAGADPGLRSGQISKKTTHLVKIACEAAVGKREKIIVFGTDYDTPDGTCIRDYIHPSDLADAHTKALQYLVDGGASVILNCGYGRGASVHDVLRVTQEVVGRKLTIENGPRRAGDPVKLVANNALIKKTLGWVPQYNSLEYIVKTAYEWEKKLL